MLLKNRRQVDPIGRRSRRIMQRGKQHVLFQAGGIGFDALQDARMKGMEKIPVAQKKADHLCAALEDPAGLRIGAESQPPDSLEYSRTRFPADLRAGIQHAGNRSDADGSGLGNFANRRFPWNCFHSNPAFCRFGALLRVAENPRPFPWVSLAHQNNDNILNMPGRLAFRCLWQEVGKPMRPIGSTRF